ncbi:class I SAM-dependent methyltransferase [Legionella sp. PATHC035]|uniref:methyltransferase domain-containing protein n=1 Tax=Legionella sp. PATHC035 TaxID=2992040 RepID=UPI002244F3A5|nr:class I SAM-dependent methyltransferase [Legionella sp. PATHC035]MCW8410463.1 class I SAM-dependent methyltransferase [Legionella sp. PATHC035]
MTTNLNGTHYLDNENESKISESISQTDPQILKPNHIIKLLKSPSRQKDVRNVFFYTFADVDQKAVLDLMSTLKEYPIDTSDEVCAATIHQWYLKLGMQNKHGFVMTDKEYQMSKAANIARIITSGLSPQSRARLTGKALLDIGAGDCAMTYLVSEALKMEGNGIDIQSNIDWGGENSSDKKNKNEYREQINRHYVYDGSDLLGALNGKKFAVVMYNHSLHHFPSFKAQFDSLKQASQILEPGGILFLSEHANCFDDEVLDLSHILLNLRYSIDKNQIPTPEDAMKAVSKFKSEYQSHYFSKNILDAIMGQLGFTLVKEDIRSVGDVAKATFFCFVKKSPREELTYSPYFFDMDKAKRLQHHTEDLDHHESIQRRYSAESIN